MPDAAGVYNGETRSNFLEVQYDGQHKIWKSVDYPYGEESNRSVGQAFLNSMRSLDPQYILEYHFDVHKEKCVKDIYQEALIIATNLQRLGLGRGDVIVLFSGNTYMTSSLTFGSLLMGGAVNFFEVKLENGMYEVSLIFITNMYCVHNPPSFR